MIVIHDYDAAKRREYYLQTRKLKGRHKKNLPTVVKKASVRKIKTHADRQKELEARVHRLKDRLAQLQDLLKQLTEAAQKRSGIGKNSTEKASTKKYESNSDSSSKYEKKTQKQKDAAAEASKKYRDKNPANQITDLNNKIKAIRERIKRLQQTGSVGASKSSTK